MDCHADLALSKNEEAHVVKPQVVFICLGNSCRSIMAEALARHLFGEALEAASAGIHPLGLVAPETLQVLAEMGVDTRGLRSKGLEEIDFKECRLLVNLTAYSPGTGVAAGPGRLIHRPMPDPYGGGLDLYRQSRDAILRLLLEELKGDLEGV
jgi:protein-tyrosine-phosphatase